MQRYLVLIHGANKTDIPRDPRVTDVYDASSANRYSAGIGVKMPVIKSSGHKHNER